MKAKEILAAGIVRDILFVNQAAVDVYLEKLQQSYYEFEVLDKFTRDDGSVIIRIVQQYNNSPLISLYDDV